MHVMTVLPGFVATRMTEGMDLPARLTTDPESLARRVLRAGRARRNVIYVSRIWWLVMFIIRAIPDGIQASAALSRCSTPDKNVPCVARGAAHGLKRTLRLSRAAACAPRRGRSLGRFLQHFISRNIRTIGMCSTSKAPARGAVRRCAAAHPRLDSAQAATRRPLQANSVEKLRHEKIASGIRNTVLASDLLANNIRNFGVFQEHVLVIRAIRTRGRVFQQNRPGQALRRTRTPCVGWSATQPVASNAPGFELRDHAKSAGGGKVRDRT